LGEFGPICVQLNVQPVIFVTVFQGIGRQHIVIFPAHHPMDQHLAQASLSSAVFSH
jgi:hypothetical protein